MILRLRRKSVESSVQERRRQGERGAKSRSLQRGRNSWWRKSEWRKKKLSRRETQKGCRRRKNTELYLNDKDKKRIQEKKHKSRKEDAADEEGGAWGPFDKAI